MPQRRAAVRRDARGQHDHALPRRAAAVEIRLHAGLNRHARSICIARHLHPLGHELLRALAQMAVFLRKLRRQWEDRVRNALVIRPRIRKASLFQKRDVHILPDAVRVDQRSIHVKNQHCLSVLSFQPEAPREVGLPPRHSRSRCACRCAWYSAGASPPAAPRPRAKCRQRAPPPRGRPCSARGQSPARGSTCPARS